MPSSELEALMQNNEDLRLAEETKKYERMLRDRNASVKNLTEAEIGARHQGGELTAHH
jgi:hypothetical protein